MRTSDGGDHWISEPSGTGADLYDVKALSGTEAWAAGVDGQPLPRN